VAQRPVGQVGEHLLDLGMVTVVLLGLDGRERGVGEQLTRQPLINYGAPRGLPLAALPSSV
jgi:hypothetical protein